jgi:quinolinate synthase
MKRTDFTMRHGDSDRLPFTPEVAAATAPLYRKVAHVVPEIEWSVHAPYIAAINALKAEKHAVILAHNYMTPEIFHCVADFMGDSLQLARLAAETDAQVIVQAGVHFMAETSKVLSPDKTVLIPDPAAGCSLAESIAPEDVRALKALHPGLPVVTYVNTSAAVKAESDVCCTSANARAVVEDIAAEWGVDSVIMIPDEFLALNTAKATKVKLVTWRGHCEVHERFTTAEIRGLRETNPGVVVLAHPECPPEVISEADFAGSTSEMQRYVGAHRPKKAVLITECSMSDNVAVDYPEIDFVRPCNLCPHMKRITLPAILHALETMTVAVTVPDEIAARARQSVMRMLAVGAKREAA